MVPLNSGTGGATMKEPDGGWDDKDLGKLFTNTAAYKGQITPLWSYTPDMASTTSQAGALPSTSGSSSFPSYIPPLLGTLLGLFCLITVAAVISFIMRRHKQKLAFGASGSDTEGSTARKHRQTWSWLLGVHGDEKSTWPRFRGFSEDLSASGTRGVTGYNLSSFVDSDLPPISPLTDISNHVTMELEGQGIQELPGRPLQLLIPYF